MKNKVIGIIVIILGIGICILSVGNFKTNNGKQKTYTETTAKVVGYEECDLDDTTGQRFIAEYKIDRDTYKIKGNVCSNMPKSLGTEVKIKYNPNNPSDAIFANDISHYFVLPIGIIFIICGFVLILKKN